jgi:hypothetical protein
MGINQFSIYASFGSNKGFLESLKCYKRKYIRFLKNYKTEDGVNDIAFYDSVEMPTKLRI